MRGEPRAVAPSEMYRSTVTGDATLFDAPVTRGASRQSDPATSRDAGRSMSGQVLRDQQALVLRAVQDRCRFHFGKDATAWECFQVIDRDTPWYVKENVISKRLGELADLGMVRLTGDTRPGSSHRHQQIYALTEQGRAWVARGAA